MSVLSALHSILSFKNGNGICHISGSLLSGPTSYAIMSLKNGDGSLNITDSHVSHESMHKPKLWSRRTQGIRPKLWSDLAIHTSFPSLFSLVPFQEPHKSRKFSLTLCSQVLFHQSGRCHFFRYDCVVEEVVVRPFCITFFIILVSKSCFFICHVYITVILCNVCIGFHNDSCRFQAALKDVDPSVCIPYWNSALDSGLPNPAMSPVFTADFFGNGEGPVVTGPFAGWITPSGLPLRQAWRCNHKTFGKSCFPGNYIRCIITHELLSAIN